MLKSCQCFSTQPGWPSPQLLPLPKVLLRFDLEESSLFPPTLLPSISYLQLWLLKAVLLPPSSVTPCHGERTASHEMKSLAQGHPTAEPRLNSKPDPEFAQPSHRGPPAHDLSWSFGCFHLHRPSKHRKHIHEGKGVFLAAGNGVCHRPWLAAGRGGSAAGEGHNVPFALT